MKKTNNLLNILRDYTKNHYKIKKSIKMNMIVFVIVLLDMLTKIKMNLFYKHEHKDKFNLF